MKKIITLLVAVVMIVGFTSTSVWADHTVLEIDGEPYSNSLDEEGYAWSYTIMEDFETNAEVDADRPIKLTYTSHSSGGTFNEKVQIIISAVLNKYEENEKGEMIYVGTEEKEFFDEIITSVSGTKRSYVFKLPPPIDGKNFAISIGVKDCGTEHLDKHSYTLKAEYANETGLYLDDDGVWRYYEDGALKKITGLVKNPQKGTWHFVENGVYSKKTGMVQCMQPGNNKGKWYFVEDGVYRKKTGMAQSIQPGSTKGRWYFIEDGIYRKKTGMVQSIQPGSTKGRWYFVESGIYRKKTGMAQSIQPGSTNGRWYFIESGIYRKKTGMVQSIQPGSTNGKWYYVESGIYRKKTGVAQSIQPGSTKGKWYYIDKGIYNNKYTGYANRMTDGKRVYIKKGVARNQ